MEINGPDDDFAGLLDPYLQDCLYAVTYTLSVQNNNQSIVHLDGEILRARKQFEILQPEANFFGHINEKN